MNESKTTIVEAMVPQKRANAIGSPPIWTQPIRMGNQKEYMQKITLEFLDTINKTTSP